MALATMAVAACSSDATTSTPAGSDAATADGGGGTPETGTVPEGGADTSTTPDADAGGACNAVVNGAAVVGEVAGAGAKPVPAGGTIVDGTYFLTKHEVFAPGTPDANTRKRTIVFAGNTFQTHENDTGQAQKQYTGTYTTSGSNLTLTVTCPISATVVIPYTATATTYVTFAKDSDGDVFSGTKQ